MNNKQLTDAQCDSLMNWLKDYETANLAPGDEDGRADMREMWRACILDEKPHVECIWPNCNCGKLDYCEAVTIEAFDRLSEQCHVDKGTYINVLNSDVRKLINQLILSKRPNED